MQIYSWTYLHLLIIVPLIFLLFVLSRNLKNMARKFYFISVSSFVFWLLFNFLYVNAPSSRVAVIFYSMLLVMVSIASGTLFLTAVNFHKKAGVWSSISGIFASLSVMIAYFAFRK